MPDTESTAPLDGASQFVARVDHYGPSEAYVGGMGSVIRAFREGQLGAETVYSHATWVPKSLPTVLRVWIRSLWHVAWAPRDSVVHVHVSEGGSLLRKGVILRIAGARRLARVVTVHGHGFDAFAARHPRLTRAALANAHTITVLTSETRALVAGLIPGTDVVEVENPVAADETISDAGEQPATAVFAGEIGTRKGADVLLAAWPRVRDAVPHAELLLAGPTSDLEPPSTDGCTYLGRLDAEEVRDLLRRSRVVVLPSRAEARPMILLEAAACGRPFIGTPVGSVAELARDGGVIVPVGEIDGLAAALVRLLSDSETATHLGRAAYAAARRRSPDVVGAVFGGLYVRARASST